MCGGKTFHAHKLVICSQSPVFTPLVLEILMGGKNGSSSVVKPFYASIIA
jgi:hypothetical protein